MAKNISVELLSGKVCILPVRPNMTIGELKEEVKVGFRTFEKKASSERHISLWSKHARVLLGPDIQISGRCS
jgi:hypothetical protein